MLGSSIGIWSYMCRHPVNGTWFHPNTVNVGWDSCVISVSPALPCLSFRDQSTSNEDKVRAIGAISV